MVTSVSKISMSGLTNAFHASFHHVVTTQLVEVGDENLGLPTGFTGNYQAAVQIEQDIVNRTLGSANTELMREQDLLRDNYFRAVRNSLRNTRFSSNAELKGLYAMIQKKLIKPYPASIVSESDHTENSHIRGFIYDVRQFLTSSQRNLLGIESDLNALEAANDAFEGLYLTRVDEYEANPAGFGIKCREKVDEFWLQLVRTLNYYVNESDNPSSEISATASNVGEYIGVLNKHIEEFLRSVKRSKTSYDSSEQNSDDNANTGQRPDDNANTGMGGDL